MNLIKKLLLKVKLTLSLFLDQNAKPKTCRNVLIFRVFGNRTCRGRATAIFQEKTIPVRKFFFHFYTRRKKEGMQKQKTDKQKQKQKKKREKKSMMIIIINTILQFTQ
jgi:hypothetical protein